MKATAVKLLTATALVATLIACGGGGGGTASPTPTPIVNTAPVANAGVDQSVVSNTIVTLDGSASSDPNSDPLTYAWSLSAKPPGSSAELVNATSAKPTFTADSAGTYIASLLVNDGKTNSSPATVNVTVSVDNAAPVANAGVAQNVSVGTIVTIDGSASSDANRDPLTYIWTLTSKPAGSAAALSSETSAKPTFSADLAGTYTASLVVNDGKVNSNNVASVSISAAVANVPPVANAGVAQNVAVGGVVTLDGSASSDANTDPLTYAWSLTSKPAVSTSVLAAATSVKPTFTADVAGTYVASLIVNDGKVSSTAVTVSVTASSGNVPPVANAGVAQNVVAGSAVILDGSASSDANKDTLSFSWTLISRPAGSAASLIQPNATKPSFTADLAGTYVASLVVNDGKVNSNIATVSITSTALPTVLASASPYISNPTLLDLNFRLKNTDAAKAILANESAFVAVASNDYGWQMKATYAQQGLFKVPVTKGHFYQFSSSSYWGPCLTVYDEAGYDLLRISCAPTSSGVSSTSKKLLVVKTGFVYVNVVSQISPVFKNADLVIDVRTNTLGSDNGGTTDLSTFATGPFADQIDVAFFGGLGADRVIAKTSGNKTVFGGEGDDSIELRSGTFSSTLFDGGDGIDTAVVDFSSAGIFLKKTMAFGWGLSVAGTPNSETEVADSYNIMLGTNSKLIKIRNVERIQFTDKLVNVNVLPGY